MADKGEVTLPPLQAPLCGSQEPVLEIDNKGEDWIKLENGKITWETDDAAKAGDHSFDIVISHQNLDETKRLSGNLKVIEQQVEFGDA